MLLQKGVYPYENMDDWEKFYETTLTKKEKFYSHVNIEYITLAEYTHAKSVCKDFEIKPFGEHHDLYVQSDVFLLADVFNNFQNMFLKIYRYDPTQFLSAPVLA